MAGPKKFGTFAGVYTPSVLTILGVIMYMRLGWVVGEAGLYAAIAIILMSHVISITTGLSISSIATDKKIKTGGIYYLLSRSLGFPMGGSIGITLFVGTALSIALYIVGFSESFLGIPAISDFLGLHQDVASYRIVGTAVLIFLVILAFISTSLALKSQFFILAAIALSLVSIIVGVFIPSNYSATEIAFSPFPEHVPLITVFAIFFPAVTGFTAGVAMSGDLKDPKKSIPRGTLWSIATGLVVYVGLAMLFAYFIDRNLLVNDNNFLLKIAWSAPLVIAGIWGATLSSALGGILGGPRIIQAVAMDKIVPKFLGKGVGESNEPRNALIFTFFLAEIGILIGELDAIAEIVSMFYIAAYGFINLAFALESWASTDFRPTFKISKWIGIIGFLASFGVMFQLNPGAMFAAFIIMWAIYFILKRKELKSESGDVWSSVWTSIARTSLTKLQEKQIEERNWKPNIILFSGDKTNREHLLLMGKAFIGKFGFLSVFDLVKKQNNEFVFTKKEQSIQTPEKGNTAIFERRHSVNDIYEGITQIASTYGFSGIEPNTLLMGWARNTKEPEKFGRLIKNIYRLDLNLLMMDYDQERKFGKKSLIDIWWRGTGQNGNLSLQLVKFLWQDESWANAKLRLMIVNPVNEERDEIYKKAQQVLSGLRIEATIKIINNQIEKRSFYDIVQTESVNSDLIFMGIPEIESGKETEFINETNRLCENIGTVILVKASSFFKALNIGSVKKHDSEIQPEIISGKTGDITPVKIDNETVAATVNALRERLEDFEREYPAMINELINAGDDLRAKTAKTIKKMVMNLRFAADNTTQETFKSRLSVIENKLLNDLSGIYLAYTESAEKRNETSHKHLLDKLITGTKENLEEFIKKTPSKQRIKYSVNEMKKEAGDSAGVRFFKWRRRLLAKAGFKTTPYRLYLKHLIIQKAMPEIYRDFGNIIKNTANLEYSYYLELQSFTTKLDHVFQELKSYGENNKIDKKALIQKIESVEKMFSELTETFRKNKQKAFEINSVFPTQIINNIALIIERYIPILSSTKM
jgi:amino acid transporter